MKENKIRAEMSLSHAEAAERIERNDEMVAVQKEPEQKTSRVSTKRDVWIQIIAVTVSQLMD